jgi:hypothetical protein
MNSTSLKNVRIQYSIYSGDEMSLQWALPCMIGHFGFVSTQVGTTSQLKVAYDLQVIESECPKRAELNKMGSKVMKLF